MCFVSSVVLKSVHYAKPEYFGITVYDFITRLRMEKARKLLLEEQMPISEVSSLVGFSHQNNFSIAFKKYFGIPPSELKS